MATREQIREGTFTNNEHKMKTSNIINYLHTHYYLEDGTPERFVSSHWKYYQNQARVQVGDIKLKGVGFGDLDSSVGIFSWLTIGSYLLKAPNKKEIYRLIKSAISITKRMGFTFTYDCYRQVCSLELIGRHLRRGNPSVIIIGDGYGVLASLIKEIYPSSQIVLVDLGRILLFQAYYCGKAHPEATHCLGSSNKTAPSDFIYCPVENLKLLDNFSFDLAINIASMQEMNKETIEFYFDYLRQHLVPQNLFYCCNRMKKKLFGNEVVEFLKYPWSEDDIHLVDECCPWHTHFLSPHTSKSGLRIGGLCIPFINYFDGEIRHRLTTLARRKDD